MSTVNRLEARDAIYKGSAAIQECFLLPDTTKISLEEVELAEEGKAWHVIFSFVIEHEPAKDPARPSWLALSADRNERVYKEVVIDALNGDIMAIKIREFGA